MFRIARSRRRARTQSTSSISTTPTPTELRSALFKNLSDRASYKSASHSRIATSPGRTYYNPTYDDLTLDMLTSRFIPNDYRKQNELWRKIYVEDATAGPAVDLYKDMPWSDFGLLGIKDPKILQLYEDCLEAIQLEAQLPFISLDFLMLGRFIPHFLFDSSKGYWSRMILHDPDYIKISPIPIPGLAPKLDLVPTDSMKQFARSKDPRDIAAKQLLSQDLLAYLLQGKTIPLDPRNTSYIARKSSASDSVGTSIYTRILDIIAYQKGLMQGSQAAVRRRLGAVRTVTVGTDEWEPTVGEINEAVEALLAAEEDPVGAIVGVRQGVEFGEAGGGSAQDILKISDEWQFLNEAKMQALGINESFMSGDATYSCCIGSTLVQTTQGLIPIKDFLPESVDEKQPYPLDVTLNSRFGEAQTKVCLYNGEAPTLRVTTDTGHEFTGTPNHPLLVLRGMDLKFVQISDIQPDDYLCLSTNKVVREKPLSLHLSSSTSTSESLEVRQPTEMTPMLSYIIGIIGQFGVITPQVFSVTSLTWFNSEAISKCQWFVQEVFGITGQKIEVLPSVHTYLFENKTVSQWLWDLGLTSTHIFDDRKVPWSILQADESSQLAFLAAILEVEDLSNSPIAFESYSPGFLQELQVILNSHGFYSATIVPSTPTDYRTHLMLNTEESFELKCRIAPYLSTIPSPNKVEEKPSLSFPSSLLSRFLKEQGVDSELDKKDLTSDLYLKGDYSNLLEDIKQTSPSAVDTIKTVFKNGYKVTKVTNLEYAGIQKVYDISMEDKENRSFVANGVISSNTMETLLSVFLERIRAHRDFITKFFIQDKILKPIAEINGFRRLPEKRLAHRYRIAESTNEELLIPTVQFSKNLRPVADREYLEILEMAQERGLPVTLKTWATFAGFDLQDEIERLPEDLALRRSLREYQAATDPDYADKIQNITQESGLVVPLRIWANAIGLDVDELAIAMEDDVALRRKFRQWALHASPEMPDKIREAIEQGVPVPISEVASAYGLSLDKLLEVKDNDVELRVEIKKWLTAVSPESRDILETAQEKGIPVTLDVWANVLGLDLERLRTEAPEDIELRKELTPWRNAAEGEFEEEEGEEGLGEEETEEEGDFGEVPGFGEEGDEEEEGLPELEMPEVPSELPEEGEEPQVLEVSKEDLPELLEKIKEKHPDADIPEIPENVKKELEKGEEGEEPLILEEPEEKIEEEVAVEKEELPVPPKAEKSPVRKLTKEQEKKLTKSIRDVLMEALKNHKKAADTAQVATKLYKNGYFSLADSMYRQGVMATVEDVPVDLGYLLDGILPDDVIPPQGYLKSDVLEYKTTQIDKLEWNQLVDSLNKQISTQSGTWGRSIAEFLRTKSPYPTHNQIAVTCVSRVRIFVSQKTKYVRLVPEQAVDNPNHYAFTYYNVVRLKRPEEIDPKKLLLTDLERSFQSQLLLEDIPEKEQGLPDVAPHGMPATPEEVGSPNSTPATEQPQQVIQDSQVVNINIPEGVPEQVVQIMKSLPIWSRDKKFVGLRQKDAEVIVKKVIKANGVGRQNRYAMQMTLFNPKKRQLAQYILARLGIVKDVTLDPDVAADIVNHLTSRVPQSANPEHVNELFMMASLKKNPETSSFSGASRPTDQDPKRWPLASNQLLTGYTTKK